MRPVWDNYTMYFSDRRTMCNVCVSVISMGWQQFARGLFWFVDLVLAVLSRVLILFGCCQVVVNIQAIPP